MSDFPQKPDDGTLGSVGRAVTLKEAPSQAVPPNYCAQCGVPLPCPGHYSDSAKPGSGGASSPPAFQPTPFKVGQ